MKIIEFVRNIFWNNRTQANFYSEAIAEGMREAFEDLRQYGVE